MLLQEVKLPLMVRLACLAAVNRSILGWLATGLMAFGCATTHAVGNDSPIPGCIGVAARMDGGQVVITSVGPAAQAAGLQAG
jgi:hypothetical protein